MHSNFLNDPSRQQHGFPAGDLTAVAGQVMDRVKDFLPSMSVNVGEQERRLSVALGGLLLTKGLTGQRFGLFSTLAGGALLLRGLTGHCNLYSALGVSTSDEQGSATVIPAGSGQRIEHGVTVRRSPEELYRFWRSLENLPRVMSHLREVRQTGGTRSHWVARGPLGMPVEWDAEITNDVTDETIAWRSVDGSTIDTAGSVHFRQVGDGTEVRVNLKFNPPAGKLGAAVARMLGENPEQQIRADLARFKEQMETGQLAGVGGR